MSPLHWKTEVLTTRPPRKSPDVLDLDCGGGYTVVYIKQKAQMCAIYYYQSSYFFIDKGAEGIIGREQKDTINTLFSIGTISCLFLIYLPFLIPALEYRSTRGLYLSYSLL